MKIAVLYQSLRGGTEQLAARQVANAFGAHEGLVGVYPVTSFDSQFVLQADLIVLGTWTDGLFGIGAKPAQLGKLNSLPSIAHRPTALFVTYEISPTRSLAGLEEWATERGANVVATASFKVRGPRRKDIAPDIEAFVSSAMAAVQTATA